MLLKRAQFVLILNPGWELSLGGFPALSGAVGQFLIKDVVLLGAAIWSLGEALILKEKPTFEP
jgi:reactive chlorine resistance protein C